MSTSLPQRVSILITAYNAEPWLAETLESALGQTWPNTEVILVDDGSTDSTLAVAQRFESPTLRVIVQENQGACAARNAALSHAQGDFIQYLDADDLLALNKIEVQMHRLADEPAGTVASGAWTRFYYDDPSTATFIPEKGWRDFEPAANWLIHAWSVGEMMAPFVWLVPRAVAEAAGPWNETLRLNQDGEYFARVLVRSPKVAFCPEAQGFYRSGLPESVSRRKDDEALASLFRTAELNEAHLLSTVDTDAARRACACMWQAFAFTAYPSVPSLVQRAEARAATLGGCDRKPEGSRSFTLLRDVIGWKSAERLRHLYYKLRYS